MSQFLKTACIPSSPILFSVTFRGEMRTSPINRSLTALGTLCRQWLFLLGLSGILLPSFASAVDALNLLEESLTPRKAGWSETEDHTVRFEWLAIFESLEEVQEEETSERESADANNPRTGVNSAVLTHLNEKARTVVEMTICKSRRSTADMEAEGIERFALFHQWKLDAVAGTLPV